MTTLVKTTLFAAFGVCCLALNTGAQPAPPPPPTPTAPPVTTVPALAPTMVYGQNMLGGFTGRSMWSEYDANTAGIVKKLSEAKTDSEKEKLRDQLKESLDKSFESRQKQHEQQVEALEAQVKKLKEMISKRKDNKKEIIEERTKQLVREAQGLGW